MKIVISKHCFSSALERTTGITDKKSSMQILSNVMISTEGSGSVRISATDLNLSATGVFPAQIIEEGTITLPAKTLYDIVRSLSEGVITVTVEEDTAEITSGRSTFKLLGLPGDDFPSVPDSTEVEFFEVPSDIMLAMIEKTQFSISNDETRPHINGAFFMGDGKILRMVTTDGHRLSKCEYKVDRSGFYNFSMIIPNKGVSEVKRILSDQTDALLMGTADGSVFVKTDIEVEKAVDEEPARTAEFVLVSKLIEADFPPYDQIIPKSLDKKVIVARNDIYDALKRVSVVSSDRTLGVKLVLTEGSIDISTDNPSIGGGNEIVDVDYQGEEMKIGFNAKYFLDVLTVLNVDELSLELSGSLDPAVVADMDGTFIGVVMPMRI